jgi:hypothetical protein
MGRTRLVVVLAGVTHFACAAPGLSEPTPTPTPAPAATDGAPPRAEASTSRPAEEDATMHNEPLAPLDPQEARDAARERGLKAQLVVPYPARCPAVAAASEPNPLHPEGALAALGVDLDALLSDGVGVPEAVALFGPPALCNHQPGSRFADLHLGPPAPELRAVTVETKDGALIGLVVDYEAPPHVPMAALRRRFGAPQSAPTSPHSSYPPPHKFTVESPAYRATILLFPRGRGDEAELVRQLIVRRTPQRAILPARFTDEEALARLLVLALGDAPADPVDFYGSLGVYSGTANGVVSLSRVDGRNVAAATLTVTATEPADTTGLDVRFEEPFPVDPRRLAAALAATLGLEASPAIERANRATIRLSTKDGRPRGAVILHRVGAEIHRVRVTRGAPP